MKSAIVVTLSPSQQAVIAYHPSGTHIIHGGSRGADYIAGTVAGELGFSVTEFPADWKNLGRSAGVRRNLAMLDEGPDLVLAFWDGRSTGTQHTITNAERRGIPVEVIPT